MKPVEPRHILLKSLYHAIKANGRVFDGIDSVSFLLLDFEAVLTVYKLFLIL